MGIVQEKNIPFKVGDIIQFDTYNLPKYANEVSKITFAKIKEIYMKEHTFTDGAPKIENGVYMRLTQVKGYNGKWNTSSWVKSKNFKLITTTEEYQIY